MQCCDGLNGAHHSFLEGCNDAAFKVEEATGVENRATTCEQKLEISEQEGGGTVRVSSQQMCSNGSQMFLPHQYQVPEQHNVTLNVL